MAARCGSIDIHHRTKECRGCDAVYKARHNSGAPRFRQRVRADPAVCIMCDLTAGNSGDIPVYRYPLKRTFPGGSTEWIGSIGMCDPCLTDNAYIKEGVRLYTKPVRQRDDGLRSSDGMPASLAS